MLRKSPSPQKFSGLGLPVALPEHPIYSGKILKRIYALKSMSYAQRGSMPPLEKPQGISGGAFGISITFVILLAIVVVVLMVLYLRRDKTLIKASECPEKVSGLLVQGDRVVTQNATNCGNQVDCLFQVTGVQDAINKCNDLGIDKCASFSLTQIPSSDNYDMQVSDATTTSVSVGTDTYRILV
jgi:hypothetical protein